jgi:preprotein translocase subunit SecB
MRPSPLRIDTLKFVHIDVSPRITPDYSEIGELSPVREYNFNGARVNTHLEHAVAQEDQESPVDQFLVVLRIELTNEGENPPPYLVDVKCIGYFTMAKIFSDERTKRIDTGVVNGASLLYGAVREMVSSVTSRSWYGELVLPTASFAEYAPSTTKFPMENVPMKSDPTPVPDSHEASLRTKRSVRKKKADLGKV